MKSWLPLCIVNGLILAVVATFAREVWTLFESPICLAYMQGTGLLFMWLLGGNARCLHDYHQAWLRDQVRKRRAEYGDYSEPYTWFRRDPNPEPLRNLEGRWKAVGR